MKRGLTMKKLAAICLILAMVPGLCCFGSAFAAAEEPTVLEHWSKDSPAMKSIVDFVEKSVDETSDGYIPKEDRIAVFDNDGTKDSKRLDVLTALTGNDETGTLELTADKNMEGLAGDVINSNEGANLVVKKITLMNTNN